MLRKAVVCVLWEEWCAEGGKGRGEEVEPRLCEYDEVGVLTLCGASVFANCVERATIVRIGGIPDVV